MSSTIDFNGNIWFGTDKGLCVFKNRPGLDEHFDPKKEFIPIEKGILGGENVQILKIHKEKNLIIGSSSLLGLLDLEVFYKEGKIEMIALFNHENGFDLGNCSQNTIWIDSKENGLESFVSFGSTALDY